MNIVYNRNHYNSKQRNLLKYRKSKIDREKKKREREKILIIFIKNPAIRELVQLEFIFCP